MVKTLQRKFLFASMLAVTILLVTLVGAINISYCYSVYSRERNMLEMLCETDGRPEGPGRFRDPNREDAASTDTGINSEAGLENGQIRDHSGRTDTEQADQTGGLMNGSGRSGFLKHGMSMDEALSIRFFAVWFEENGQAVLTDTSRIYAVSGEEAEEMAQVIVTSGKNTGVYQGFRYLVEEKDCTLSIEAEPVTAAKILVAMDISSDRRDMLRILAISVLIAALCWAAMLLPVNALSRRAIAPTAMSIERQKEFVTNAGHELKTPLAIIQANTDALELHAGESKWTRNIRAQTVRLNVLMQNLLTLSRMDENSLKLEKKPFAINPLLGEVWEDFAEPAAGKKLSVQIRYKDHERISAADEKNRRIRKIREQCALTERLLARIETVENRQWLEEYIRIQKERADAVENGSVRNLYALSKNSGFMPQSFTWLADAVSVIRAKL